MNVLLQQHLAYILMILSWIWNFTLQNCRSTDRIEGVNLWRWLILYKNFIICVIYSHTNPFSAYNNFHIKYTVIFSNNKYRSLIGHTRKKICLIAARCKTKNIHTWIFGYANTSLEIDKRLQIYEAKTRRFSTLEISFTLACGLAQQRKKYNRSAFYTPDERPTKKK